jgi:hypothetical protein
VVLPEFAPKMMSADGPDALGTRRDSTTLATPGAASQRNPDVSPQNGPQANDGTELEEPRYGWHQDSTNETSASGMSLQRICDLQFLLPK